MKRENCCQVANPFVEVENNQAFEKELGIVMEIPANAEEIRCSICDHTFCQMNFVINGCDYTYRAQKNIDLQRLSGVYGDWIASNRYSKAQYYRCDEYSIAGWEREDVCYCLEGRTDEETLSAIVEPMLK